MRNGGQAEPSTSFENAIHHHEDSSIDADADSDKLQTIADFDALRIKRVFSDRLAELVANIQGGRHVTATLMVESADKVQVLVAKNKGLTEYENGFLKKLESRLRSIASMDRKFFPTATNPFSWLC
jgi:ribosomal protein S6E (S10)